MPSLLERRVLSTAAVPSRVLSRAEIAEPFARSGFPVPLDSANEWRRPLVAAAVVLGLAVAGGTAIYLMRPQPQAWTSLNAAEAPVAPLPSPAHSEAPTIKSLEGYAPSAAPSPQPGASAVTLSAALPSPPSAASPSAAASPRPSASQPKRPVPPPVNPADPSRAAQTQVDSLFADSTVGCPSRWTGTATTYVRGGNASAVTFLWGESAGVLSHAVPLPRAQTVTYQATVTGLPMNTTVYWRVAATMDNGQRITTSISSITHQRQC
jgi:hypothetical protein